eukprot:622777-Lingulodinium_polyedra.AAC.1
MAWASPPQGPASEAHYWEPAAMGFGQALGACHHDPAHEGVAFQGPGVLLPSCSSATHGPSLLTPVVDIR